jgi:hypothetical protein
MSEFAEFLNTPEDVNVGVLAPRALRTLMRRRPPVAPTVPTSRTIIPALTLEDSSQIDRLYETDALVRLPALHLSSARVILLQRWVGRVERLLGDTMIATLEDETDSQNSPEEVELDLSEISPSDQSLVAPGAVFYWSIGYYDSPGGQRERVSTLRFARFPKPDDKQIKLASEKALELAVLLESD